MAGLGIDKDIDAGLAEAKRDEFDLERKAAYDDSALGSGDDDFERPTEEETLTLRSVPDHLPWGAYRKY